MSGFLDQKDCAGKGMFRITPVREDFQSICLKIEGRVVGKWVTELDHFCVAFLVMEKSLVLDLSGVSFIDQQGITLVKHLQRKSVKLQGARPLVKALLEL